MFEKLHMKEGVDQTECVRQQGAQSGRGGEVAAGVDENICRVRTDRERQWHGICECGCRDGSRNRQDRHVTCGTRRMSVHKRGDRKFVINLFLLFVGMVMDTSPAILVTTPILLPIIVQIGMDPVQFGIVMVVNLAVGFVTPPVGVNLFVASSLGNVPVREIAKKALPMIFMFLIALMLITFIPAISLTL